MPTSFSRFYSVNIKHLSIAALFLLLPIFFFAQSTSLTGLWTGALSNDSATVRKDQSFEIALTEYHGKVYGYSRSEFIVNDTLFYIVKRVKGTIENDVCEVTDDDIIAYNFRGKLDKGIKVTSTFRRNKSDSTWYLDGTWKTNATKKYYSVTGKVGLQEEQDLNASKLFPHLEELNLANDVAFYKEFKERKDEPVIVKIVKPEKIKSEYNDRPSQLSINNDVTIEVVKPNLQKAEPDITSIPVISATEEPKADLVKEEMQKDLPVVKRPAADLTKTDIKDIPVTTVLVTPSAVTKTIAGNKKPETKAVTDKMNTTVAINSIGDKKINTPDNSAVTTKAEITSKPIAKQEQPVVKNQPANTSATIQPAKDISKTSNVLVSNTTSQPQQKNIVTPDKTTQAIAINVTPEKKETKPETIAIPEAKKTDADIIAKSAIIEGRKSEFSQIVNFKSDSLELSLYDNGEIDGDTVSVFMNGEVFMPRQGLKASAIKKTIYITKENEEFTLVMFADNLGKYPPNTGLLVVHDGDDVYNLRFSSDFQKSSGIVFRKKN